MATKAAICTKLFILPLRIFEPFLVSSCQRKTGRVSVHQWTGPTSIVAMWRNLQIFLLALPLRTFANTDYCVSVIFVPRSTKLGWLFRTRQRSGRSGQPPAKQDIEPPYFKLRKSNNSYRQWTIDVSAPNLCRKLLRSIPWIEYGERPSPGVAYLSPYRRCSFFLN